jgi:hypothetical protein
MQRKPNVCSCLITAGLNHGVEVGNESLKTVAELKCLGMAVANKNFIPREVRVRLILGNYSPASVIFPSPF